MYYVEITLVMVNETKLENKVKLNKHFNFEEIKENRAHFLPQNY